MFIQSTSPLYPNVFLFTLGLTARYAVQTSDAVVLFDPGSSAHIPGLVERCKQFFLQKPKALAFLTHLHADCVAGLPILQEAFPSFSFLATNTQADLLAEKDFLSQISEEDQCYSNLLSLPLTDTPSSFRLPPYRSLTTKESFPLSDEVSLRCLPFPGHTESSCAYLLSPYQILIADEGLGYFQGRELPAPGGDWSLEQNKRSLEKILELDFSGIALPQGGFVSGELARRHIRSTILSIEDLLGECQRASQAGYDLTYVTSCIKESFFQQPCPDPIVRFQKERSFRQICQQIEQLFFCASNA